ncbi:hypothetical protein H1R20_g4397, partial [Candolleomyces eurysporus]
MDLRRGSQATVNRVVSFPSSHAKSVTTIAEIAQVTTISANGDTHVGNLIACRRQYPPRQNPPP